MTRLSKLLLKRIKSRRKNLLKEKQSREKPKKLEQEEGLTLDPDRPILEQLEDMAVAGDEQAEKELDKILANPKLTLMYDSPGLRKLSSNPKTGLLSRRTPLSLNWHKDTRHHRRSIAPRRP